MEGSARARERFLEFRSSGDPEALAEVFDLCAQELLLVAHHLAAPGVSSEDLLQSTFLVAMKNAESFDADRALMPWLCGILANTARSESRRARRHAPGVAERGGRGHGSAVGLEVARAEVDPADVAGAREFTAELTRALAEFPARQREILTLRLVHGLTPTEIAHALREPVGTVKSWIHRGVARLRLRLPAGFAASLALFVAAEDGLAQVREAILAEASRAHPVPPRAGDASSLERATRVSVGATAAGAALVGLIAWSGLWERRSDPEPAVVSSSAAPVAGARGSAGEVRRDPLEEIAGSPVGTRSAPASHATRIRVRFADGALAAIALRLTPLFGSEPAFRAVALHTSAAGEATIDDLPPGRWELLPDRGDPRAVEVHRGATIEVDLAEGRDLHGRVLDRAGRPVAGAGVWLSEALDRTRGQVAARTAADGRYVLRGAPLDRVVAAVAPGHRPSAMRAVFVAAEPGSSSDDPLDLVLGAPCAPLTGTVVDARGAPVVGALLRVRSLPDVAPAEPDVGMTAHHAAHPAPILRTDDDGRFRAEWTPPPPLEVWVRGAETASRRLVVDGARAVAEVPFDMDPIVLGPGGSLTGTLPATATEVAGAGAWTDAADDAAAAERSGSVAWVAVLPTAEPEGAFEDPPRFAAPQGFFPAGPFVLHGLRAGAQRLFARAWSGATDERVVELRSREAVEWSPRIGASVGASRPRAARGVAVDSAGAPLVGYRVVVVDEDRRTAVEVVDEAGRFGFDDLEGEPQVLWLHGPEGGYPGSLTHRVLSRRALDGAQDGETVLRLPAARRPSATLRARVRDGVEIVETVRATSAADLTIVPGSLDDDGFVTFPPLPPGDWFLTVSGNQGMRLIEGPIALGVNETREIDGVEVPGAGRVQVRVEAEGATVPDRIPCALMTEDGSFMATYFVVADGATITPTVPAGRYVCHALAPLAIDPVPVEVVPDGTTEATLRAAPGAAVALHVRHPSLCAGVRLRLDWRREVVVGAGDAPAAEWSQVTRVVSVDGGGSAVEVALRPGVYDVVVTTCEGRRGRARFEIGSASEDPAAVPTIDVDLE